MKKKTKKAKYQYINNYSEDDLNNIVADCCIAITKFSSILGLIWLLDKNEQKQLDKEIKSLVKYKLNKKDKSLIYELIIYKYILIVKSKARKKLKNIKKK